MEKTIFLDRHIEVVVVSAGGVGTTFLMEAIAKYKKVNKSSNADGYKHLPIPPISFNSALKVVYVYGDPVLACLSLFRRNYHHAQSKWATKFQEDKYIIPATYHVEDYATRNEDGHYFEEHKNNWEQKYLCYPTFFIKYDDIHNSIQDLSSFLDLPPSFIDNFPERKPRQSASDKLSQETLSNIKKIYATYKNEVDNLSGFYIKEPEISKMSLFSEAIYRKAIAEALYKKFSLFRKIKNKFR